MDRVRFISLTIGAAQSAYEDHIVLIDALQNRDKSRIEPALIEHLGRIEKILEKIRLEKPEFFQD